MHEPFSDDPSANPASGDSTTQLKADSLFSEAACPERYVIKSLIGHGGMGMVFHAIDTELDRDVAIKVHFFAGAREEDSQERFLREAKALAFLNHPGIVKIFSSGLNAHGNPYHVMEYLHGVPLSEDLAKGPLDAARFIALFSTLLSGLEHAHNEKIVHRDLKPSNIMRCKDVDGNDIYKIIDFGIAKIDVAAEMPSHTLTRTDSILGSPLYISPEQCSGQRGTASSDLYAVGCMMYECVSGKPPLQGESAFETMYMHMSVTPLALDQKSNSAKSKELAELIASCLEKKPENRPANAAELLAKLRQIFTGDLTLIDLFNNKVADSKKKTPVQLIGAAILVPSILALAALVYFKPMQSGTVNVTKKSSEEIQVSQIEKAKKRLARWKDPLRTIKDPTQKGRYLSDLFALGREQLKSSEDPDLIDAEKNFTDGLAFCVKVGGISQNWLLACHVMRAKAKWKLGDFPAAEAEFADVYKQAPKDTTKNDILIDILLERGLMETRQRKFASALADFKRAVDIYENETLTVAPLDLCGKIDKTFSKIDKEGDPRPEMGHNLAKELRKIPPPKNSEEAVQMVQLSNAVAEQVGLHGVVEVKYVRAARAFSVSLLPKIDGNKALKDATIAQFKATPGFSPLGNTQVQKSLSKDFGIAAEKK